MPLTRDNAARNAYMREWNARNRDKKKAQDRKYYLANKEKVLATNKAWTEANAEKKKEADRANYQRNREERLAKQRAWQLANPEKLAEQQRRRRAQKRGEGAFVVTEQDWKRLCARYDHACAYCRAHAPLEREHVVPLSRGGRHSIGNLLPACRACNASKHDKYLVEWRQVR